MRSSKTTGSARKPASTTPATIDDYVRSLSPPHRDIAERIRTAIRVSVPEATEAIKYGMPAFLLDGSPFVYFAVWKKHVGMYPVYAGPPDLEAQVAPYRDKKDTVRFVLNQPLPLELVATIATFLAARRRSSA